MELLVKRCSLVLFLTPLYSVTSLRNKSRHVSEHYLSYCPESDKPSFVGQTRAEDGPDDKDVIGEAQYEQMAPVESDRHQPQSTSLFIIIMRRCF